MGKYKTYLDDNGDEVEFTVFIIHGHSEDFRKVERFIKDELGFRALVLKESYSGKVVLDKFRDTIWDEVDCAVALLTPDDTLANGSFRARQNVLYELGYCQGVFDSYYSDDDEFESTIIIKDKSIDLSEVSNLLGVECLEYSDHLIESTFFQLGRALKKIYKALRDNP